MRRLMLIGALVTIVAPLHAQKRADSAAFVIRLGTDTTAIERYVRTNDQLIVESVQRSPTTSVHRLVLDLTPANQVAKGQYVMTRPGATSAPVERTLTPPAGFIPMIGSFYSLYEMAMMRGVAAGAKATVNMLAGSDTVAIPVERVGSDSVTLTNQFGEPMRAHIDANGRLLHLHTPAYTTVERIKWVDLDRMTSDFVARDASGKAMGILSPRHTYRTRVGGANIWVDYSRPAMRGRPIWGSLVPFGAVWRTGANDAAHLSTDRTLELGGLTLTPGTYTLFLLPAANEWTLIVNRQTGMSGLARDAANDVGRVTLTTETLQQPVESFLIGVSEVAGGGGRLSIAWDRTRGSVSFAVK